MKRHQSRLRRFSGADRFGVMLDLARLYQMRGETRVARDWAHAAYVRAQSGNASWGSKLEVFAVYADLSIRMAEDGSAQADELDDGQRVANEIYEVSESLRYLPFRGIAEYLLARCLLLRHRRMNSDPRGRRNPRTIEDALSRIRRAQQTMRSISDFTFRREIANVRKQIVEAMN
jgi:hypothetical protein